MSNLRPMLAAEAILGQITYPKLVSPKLNGVRGLVINGVLMARSLKKIPNQYCQYLFSRERLTGFDGELVVGPFNAEEVFTESTSGVMSQEGTPDVSFWVFDFFMEPNMRLVDRIKALKAAYHSALQANVVLVPYKLIHSDTELKAFDKWAQATGYEGTVLRDPNANYKFGRSTEKEQGFLRYVEWLTSEAVILRIDERMHNANPQKQNELGYAKRSSHKDNKIPMGVAGSMLVRDLKTKVEFNVTIGGDELQADFWKNRKGYPGKIIRYKFRAPVKGLTPRFPILEGFRSKLDR